MCECVWGVGMWVCEYVGVWVFGGVWSMRVCVVGGVCSLWGCGA